MSFMRSIDALFIAPTRFPPSRLAPAKLAGPTADSTKALLRILRHNYVNHHVFFDLQGRHNHAAHHMISIYAMGANVELLDAAYATHQKYQRPAFKSPVKIDSDNFADHLGDENYYQAYLDYFSKEVLNKGVSKTLEENLFAKEFNYEGKQAKMLSRFLGGLLHSMIHTGYGAEFGLLSMVAEGLAMAAMEKTEMSPLILPSYWDIDPVVDRLSSVVLGDNLIPEISVFNVLAMIQEDDRLSSTSLGLSATLRLAALVNKASGAITKYADMWTLNLTASTDFEGDLERKLEELAVAATLIYGIGGMTPSSKPFQADFFLMHLVTSSVFLPSLCAKLEPKSIQLLLRTYLSSLLAVWVARGRPNLRITKEFMTSTNPSPQEPNAAAKPATKTLTPQTVTPNSWLTITQSVLEHPDEHLCKTQRSLMHWASLFGNRPSGEWVGTGGAKSLEGIELLDGSIFIRVAGLTADALGWMREGQEQRMWDFGFRIE